MQIPLPLLSTGVALAALLALPGTASATCQSVSRGYKLDGSTQTTLLYVKKDQGCGTMYSAGGRFTLSSLEIVEKPRIGLIEKTSRFGYSYYPKDGFTGTDMFVIKLCGTHNIQGPGCQTIRHEVTVR